MNVYIARLLSFKADKSTTIPNMLADTSLQQLVFPAKVYTTGDHQAHVTAVEQVNEVFAQKRAEKKPITVLTLYSINGLEFSFTFYFTGAALPIVVLLKFTGEHVVRGVVSLETCSRLIEHGIEQFALDHATVYDDAAIPTPYGLQYFKGPEGCRYPIQLGWLNYFGSDLVDFIGRERFASIQGYTRRLHDSGGITLTYAKETVLFADNYQSAEGHALTQLGLADL